MSLGTDFFLIYGYVTNLILSWIHLFHFLFEILKIALITFPHLTFFI